MAKGGMCGEKGCMAKGACMAKGGLCMVKEGGVHGIRRDTINERVVRILLEYILVHCKIAKGS